MAAQSGCKLRAVPPRSRALRPRHYTHSLFQTKFLIGRDGQPLQRYKPGFDPLDFEGDVSPRRRAAEHDPPTAASSCMFTALVLSAAAL